MPLTIHEYKNRQIDQKIARSSSVQVLQQEPAYINITVVRRGGRSHLSPLSAVTTGHHSNPFVINIYLNIGTAKFTKFIYIV